MALAKKSKSPSVKALKPHTRLVMTFRELAIEGKKDWRHAWVFAQFAADEGDEDMMKVMEVFRALKHRDQKTATPEYCCDLAGVDPNDFAAEVFRHYLKYAGDAANLIEAASRPEVVRRQVKFAMDKDGHADRRMLHEHSGFLPQRKGGGIHVNASANLESQVLSVQAPELPTMESDTNRFTKALKDSTKTVTIEAQVIPAAQKVPALEAPPE